MKYKMGTILISDGGVAIKITGVTDSHYHYRLLTGRHRMEFGDVIQATIEKYSRLATPVELARMKCEGLL